MTLTEVLVHGLIIHKVDKPLGSREEARLTISKKPLATGREAEMLSAKVDTILRTKTSRDYGGFVNDHPFPTELQKYLASRNHFHAFSRITCERFGEIVSGDGSIRGGYLAYLHHSPKGEDILDVFVLNDTESLQVQEGDQVLDLAQIEHLDLQSFAYAARVYLNRWKNNDDIHISFVKGRRGKAARYFQDFIGADTRETKEESERARDVIFDFIDSNIQVKESATIRKKTEQYLLNQHDLEQSARLEDLAELISDDESLQQAFVEAATGPEYQVPLVFGIDKSTVKKLTELRVNTPSLSLTARGDMVSNIHVSGKDVVIKNAPVKLLDEIRRYNGDAV